MGDKRKLDNATSKWDLVNRMDVIENILLVERLFLVKLIESNKRWLLEKNGLNPEVVCRIQRIVSPVHHLQKMTIIFSDVPVVCDLQPMLPKGSPEFVHRKFLQCSSVDFKH
jgi:hypothetical protein